MLCKQLKKCIFTFPLLYHFTSHALQIVPLCRKMDMSPFLTNRVREFSTLKLPFEIFLVKQSHPTQAVAQKISTIQSQTVHRATIKFSTCSWQQLNPGTKTTVESKRFACAFLSLFSGFSQHEQFFKCQLQIVVFFLQSYPQVEFLRCNESNFHQPR